LRMIIIYIYYLGDAQMWVNYRGYENE
jgi:hypothetical protein